MANTAAICHLHIKHVIPFSYCSTNVLQVKLVHSKMKTQFTISNERVYIESNARCCKCHYMSTTIIYTLAMQPCTKRTHTHALLNCIPVKSCGVLGIYLVTTNKIIVGSTIVVCFIPGGNDYQGRIKNILYGNMVLNATDYFGSNRIGCCLSVKDINISTIKIKVSPKWSNNWHWLWKWPWVR